MKRAFAALVCVPLLAGCFAPDDVDEFQLAAFDDAVTSIGCVLETERQYLPVELQTGLTREKVAEVAAYRVSRREAEQLESGGIRLI